MRLTEISHGQYSDLAARFHPAYPFYTDRFTGRITDDTPHYLADDPASPRVLVSHGPAEILMLGEDDGAQLELVRQLYTGRLEPTWPTPATQHRWDGYKRRHFRLRIFGMKVLDAALDMGFVCLREDRHKLGQHFYYIEGEPRFGHMVKHQCSARHGLELYDRMRLGIDYDQTGEYTRSCLLYGPSFVCEVDGEPVCWSCTHTNGLLGMIYTPPEHRRKGYATSLAAFQIDYMLKRDGYAHILVLENNTASQGVLAQFGAKRIEQPMYWRELGWRI